MLHLLLIPTVDIFSILVSKFFYPDEQVHHNRRWFMIHAFVNGLVTYYNFGDLMLCMRDPLKYPLLPMSQDSFFSTDIMIVSHFYHMTFFYPYLKKDEWFHHLLMMSLSGTSVYILGNKSQASYAFFLSGLPGLIDYSLLWGVKMKFVPPWLEKNVYLYLTTYVRSPGTMMVTCLTVPHLARFDGWMWSYCGLLATLNFWNGQYYMMKSCRDHERWMIKNNY